MRAFLAATAALAILGTGCIIVPAHRSQRSAVSAEKCPPGHQWSDGRCHERGKGHDPARRER